MEATKIIHAPNGDGTLFSSACPNPACDCPRCAAQRQATAERLAELLEELAAIDEEGQR